MKAIIYTTKNIKGIEDAMPKGITCDVKYEKNFPITKQVTWSLNHNNTRKPEIILNWDTVPAVAGYDFSGVIVDKRKAGIRRGLHGIARKPACKFQVFYSTKKKALETIKHELLHLKAHELGLLDKLHTLLKQGKTLDEVDEMLEYEPEGEQLLVKRMADELISQAQHIGIHIRITSFYRSFAEQDKLYKKVPKVTNAKGGESFHNYGVAFDIVDKYKGYNLTREEWKLLRFIWRYITKKHTGHYGVWGGDWVSFRDKPHFQLTLGYSLKDFQNNRVDYSKFK